MAAVDEETRQILAGIVAPLVERHGGDTAVANKVGVNRSTVHRWVRGDIPLPRLGHLAAKLEEEILIRFPPGTAESAPPEWAERPVAILELLAAERGISDTDIERQIREAVRARLVPASQRRSPRQQRSAGNGAGR